MTGLGDDPTPASRRPNDITVQLWEKRRVPAVVTLRCGRGRCRRRVARIFETPGGAVVVFHQPVPDRPATIDGGIPEGWEDEGLFRHLDVEQGAAVIRGVDDPAGSLVHLEADDLWADVVEAGCPVHLDFVHLSRSFLMTALRRARASAGRPGRDRHGVFNVDIPRV